MVNDGTKCDKDCQTAYAKLISVTCAKEILTLDEAKINTCVRKQFEVETNA